jgi:hypothetical protein
MGPGIPEPLSLIVQQAIFCAGANTAGGALGAQAQAITIAVVEAVHFFFDYIGNFSNGTLKQFSLLQYRKTNFTIAVARQYIGNCSFEVLPGGGLFWGAGRSCP